VASQNLCVRTTGELGGGAHGAIVWKNAEDALGLLGIVVNLGRFGRLLPEPGWGCKTGRGIRFWQSSLRGALLLSGCFVGVERSKRATAAAPRSGGSCIRICQHSCRRAPVFSPVVMHRAALALDDDLRAGTEVSALQTEGRLRGYWCLLRFVVEMQGGLAYQGRGNARMLGFGRPANGTLNNEVKNMASRTNPQRGRSGMVIADVDGTW